MRVCQCRNCPPTDHRAGQTCYNYKVIKGTPPHMQITNNVTTVDFFPEAFIAEADETKGMIVTVKRFQKRVTFNANGLKSYSTVTALTARNEWDTRIANGAVVTDFNLDQMPRSEYTPMAVG